MYLYTYIFVEMFLTFIPYVGSNINISLYGRARHQRAGLK